MIYSFWGQIELELKCRIHKYHVERTEQADLFFCFTFCDEFFFSFNEQHDRIHKSAHQVMSGVSGDFTQFLISQCCILQQQSQSANCILAFSNQKF